MMRRDARRAVDVQTTQPTPVRVTSAARDSERWLGTAHPRVLMVGWIAADHGDVEERPVRAPGSYTASPWSYSAPAEPQRAAVTIVAVMKAGEGVLGGVAAGQDGSCQSLDEKRKRVSDPHRLARVRDLLARPQVTLLVDRYCLLHR